MLPSSSQRSPARCRRVPTFGTTRQLTFVTTRQLVLHPIFVPKCSTFFCTTCCDQPSTCSRSILPLPHVCLAVSPHQLTTRTSTCCTPALFQIVLEPTAATPPVVPLVPMSGQPTYLCSNRLSTNLRRPSYQCDPNSCPSILCDLHWFVCFALRRAPPFREILSSLSCRGVCRFLCFGSSLCPSNAHLCPCLCPCWACLCRSCQFIHLFGCVACIRFAFGNLLSCVQRFHTMTCTVPLKFLDLDCHRRQVHRHRLGDHTRHFRFHSQTPSILSCQQC